MSNVLSLLTDKEKDMISDYIDAYAIPEDCGAHRSSINYILREWAKAKDQWLGNIFGDKLIVSEPITYTKPIDEIVDQLESHPTVRAFINEYFAWIKKLNVSFEISCRLSELVRSDVLRTNKYIGDPFEIADPSRPGKNIIIPFGCKPMKIIGKLYNAYSNLNGDFEEFRIAVSQILNTAKVSGNLCLSIHPLDYMTMSDNDCGWDSCMSWKEEGSYRQGTVEMMNSPYVVVAYLAAKDDMNLVYRYKNCWNSKKWRSLFIAHPSFIGNVKGYPYQLPEVDKLVIEKLQKMIGSAYGEEKYAYRSVVEYDYDDRECDGYLVRFRTGYMYNDFGSLSRNYGSVERHIPKDQEISIYYSGRSECMVCGNTNIDIDNESLLVCEGCYTLNRCDECGDSSPNLIETGDGTWVCESCLCDYYAKSMADDEYYRTDNMTMVYVLPGCLKDHIKDVDILHSYNIPIIYDNYDYDLSDEHSKIHFEEHYLKKTCEVNVIEPRHPWGRSSYYIFYSDLADEWIDTFESYVMDSYGSNYKITLRNYTMMKFTSEAASEAFETYLRDKSN